MPAHQVALTAPPPRHRRRCRHHHHRHRLCHRRRRLRRSLLCRRCHLPPPDGQHRRPLDATSNRRWCRLHHHHRLLGCHFHRCHHRQQASCCSTMLDMEAPFIHSNVTCPPSHHGSIGRCVRRLYVCSVDRREQRLLLSMNWVVVTRPVEDAAGGRRPAACMPLLHALMHTPHRVVTLSLSL